ncbi:AraC family transcriptional regulator [Acidaminobacter sp. JC074]|uniref:AraC family transcriptional regulator n=1 Tax=Acidaminobacter sp. JC074 TaxID=2530199 RepID=UPI001F115D83|nr:AraC family transcriptional regulator [Acidaminobacter sp. JC074]MCH4887034.1 AraC family transcriptional regulator [Acidaminobacter sp. JC074]
MKFDKYALPHYNYSNYRQFYKGEKHVTRTIDHYVLVMVLKGTLTFREDSKNIEVSAGQWYIQKPGLLQEGLTSDYEPRYYYIHFYGSEVDHLEHTITLDKRGQFNQDMFIPLFDKLSKVNTFDDLESQITFLRILKKLSEEKHILNSNHIADQMMMYLSSNYNQDISIQSMSKLFNFSPDHLTRQFKKKHHLTPSQYLIQLRLEKAKQLLLDTDMTVQSIALTIGYHDISVFYKMFKKHLKTTPVKWRQNFRGL